MLCELAEGSSANDPGCNMLRACVNALDNEITRIKPLLGRADGDQGGQSSSRRRRPTSEGLKSLRHHMSQERQRLKFQQGSDHVTPCEDRLRLRASAVYSVQRSLESQTRRLQQLAATLPAMKPALQPLIDGLEAQGGELLKLLEHTIRWLEHARVSCNEHSKQLVWLDSAEAEVMHSSSNNTQVQVGPEVNAALITPFNSSSTAFKRSAQPSAQTSRCSSRMSLAALKKSFGQNLKSAKQSGKCVQSFANSKTESVDHSESTQSGGTSPVDVSDLLV